MSQVIEEVNLETNLPKKERGGNRGGNRRDNNRRREQKSRSRSRSPQRRLWKRGRGRSNSQEQGEVSREQQGQQGGKQQNVIVIKNMMAINRISDIIEDIKIRAGDFKDMEITMDRVGANNADEIKIEIKIFFYDNQSCDKCIRNYNEAKLDNQTLQCYKL